LFLLFLSKRTRQFYFKHFYLTLFFFFLFLIICHSSSRTNCSLDAPFTGEITVVESEKPVRSIDLQLVRVETLGTGDGKLSESTEIQNLQIGAGDVCRNLPIPLYMVFPRVFTAPSVATDSYKVQFEVNVNVSFEGDYTAISNFPIKLYRSSKTVGLGKMN
jgi:hypothetical protein